MVCVCLVVGSAVSHICLGAGTTVAHICLVDCTDPPHICLLFHILVVSDILVSSSKLVVVYLAF